MTDGYIDTLCVSVLAYFLADEASKKAVEEDGGTEDERGIEEIRGIEKGGTEKGREIDETLLIHRISFLGEDALRTFLVMYVSDTPSFFLACNFGTLGGIYLFITRNIGLAILIARIHRHDHNVIASLILCSRQLSPPRLAKTSCNSCFLILSLTRSHATAFHPGYTCRHRPSFFPVGRCSAVPGSDVPGRCPSNSPVSRVHISYTPDLVEALLSILLR